MDDIACSLMNVSLSAIIPQHDEHTALTFRALRMIKNLMHTAACHRRDGRQSRR